MYNVCVYAPVILLIGADTQQGLFEKNITKSTVAEQEAGTLSPAVYDAEDSERTTRSADVKL